MKYIGLDIGTSSCKASIIDECGTVSMSASREYTLTHPAPGFVEIDPELVWKSVCDILREIAPASKDTVSIAVSSIGETMVLLDKFDRPIVNGIVYLDNRCQSEIADIMEKIEERELFEITLVPMNQMFSLSKLIWYRKHSPKVLEHTSKICLFGDFISYKLCGETATDPATASRTMFFDAVRLAWSDRIASLFQIPVPKIPKIVPSGTCLGQLLPSVAKETCLSEKLRVLCGAHDQAVATLGSGSIREGMMTLGEGTSESLNLLLHRKKINLATFQKGIAFEPFVDKDLYIMTIGHNAHGICVQWFNELFKTDSTHNEPSYDCPDDLFFLPFLAKTSVSEPTNISPACFIGLGLTTNQSRLYSAILEGLSFESRVLLNTLQNFGGIIHEIRATGGGSRSDTLMKLKANILNQAITTQRYKDAGILGLCMIGAVSNGEYNSYAEAAANMIQSSKTFLPDRSYDQKFERYREIRTMVGKLFRA